MRWKFSYIVRSAEKKLRTLLTLIVMMMTVCLSSSCVVIVSKTVLKKNQIGSQGEALGVNNTANGFVNIPGGAERKKCLPLKNLIMKKYKIRNWYNYEPGKGEVNSGEVMVQPDMSYTIEEILDKFTKGLGLPIGTDDGYPEDEPTFDDITIHGDNMQDIVDLEEVVKVVETKKKAKKQKSEDPKVVKGGEDGVNDAEDQNVK